MSLGQDGKTNLELGLDQEQVPCQDHQDPEYGPFRDHNLEHVLCARTKICELLNSIAKTEQLEHDTLAGWLEARVKQSKDRWIQIEEESLYHPPLVDKPMTAKKARKRAILMAREKARKAKLLMKSSQDDRDSKESKNAKDSKESREKDSKHKQQGHNSHSSKSASKRSRSSKRESDDKNATFPYEQAQPYDYLFNSKSGDDRDKQNSIAILEMVKRDMVPAMETIRNAIKRMKQVESEIEARIVEQIAERSRRFPRIISELKKNAYAYKDDESEEEEEDLDSDSDDSDSASEDDSDKTLGQKPKSDAVVGKKSQDKDKDKEEAEEDDDEDDEDNDGTYSDNDNMSESD